MTEYESNFDVNYENGHRKKEEFINYYRDYDSNCKKSNNANSLYLELIKVYLINILFF